MDARIWHKYCMTEERAEPAHLTLRQWKSLSDGELAEHAWELETWLEDMYFPTELVAMIESTMTDFVRKNSKRPIGAKDILVFTGKNTIGKSTLTQVWGRKLYRDWMKDAATDERGRPIWNPGPDVEADLCPIVWANARVKDRNASPLKNFDLKILDFFGLSTEGRAPDLTRRVVNAVQRHCVRVLIVDDMNILKWEANTARAILDHLKNINTELGEVGASMILIGADLEGGQLVGDPQIEGRMQMLHLLAYEVDSEDEKREWQQVVREIEDRLLPHLPAGEPGMLFARLAGDLWLRSQGYLGDLKKLVVDATVAATLDRRHVIKRNHLDDPITSVRAQRRFREIRSGRLAAPGRTSAEMI